LAATATFRIPGLAVPGGCRYRGRIASTPS
jgi:hypothetical protein